MGGLAIVAGLPAGAQVSSTPALGGGPGLGVAGTFDAVLAPPPLGVFALTVHGAFDRRRLTSGIERGLGRVESSASHRWGAVGTSVGLGVERPTNVPGARVQPLLTARVWREMGRLVLSLGTEAHSARTTGRAGALHLETLAESAFDDTTHLWRHWVDSSMAGDSGSASRALQWADVAARATWSSDRLTVDARLGMQPKLEASPRTVWARATATVAMSPAFAFVAGAGTEPSRGWIGLPSSRFLSFGIRVAVNGVPPGAPPAAAPRPLPRFSVKEAGGELYLLTLRLADARTVEISGDFTGWRPVSMRQTSRDTWQAMVALTRGSHRANVRIDGNAWIAPPGMSSTTDGFNGTVGIFVVR